MIPHYASSKQSSPSSSDIKENKETSLPQWSGRKVSVRGNLSESSESKEKSSSQALETSKEEAFQNLRVSKHDSLSRRQKSRSLLLKKADEIQLSNSIAINRSSSDSVRKRLSISPNSLNLISSPSLLASHIETDPSNRHQNALVPKQKPAQITPHLLIETPSSPQNSQEEQLVPKDISSAFIAYSLEVLFHQKDEKEIINFMKTHGNLNAEIHKLFFEKIFFQLCRLSDGKNPLNRHVSLFINILTVHLKTMESCSILLHRKKLEEIGKYGEEIKLLIFSSLQKAHAREFTHILLQQTTPDQHQAVLCCHPRFVPTGHFIQALCQQAVEQENQRTPLLQAIFEVINNSIFYPISHSSLLNLYQLFQSLPQQNGLKGIKEKLLSTVWTLLKSPSLPHAPSQSSLETFPQALQQTQDKAPPLSFQKITEAINENKVNKEIIRNIARDLKKIENTFLSLILPRELMAYIQKIPLEDESPVSSYIHYTNMFSYFVTSHILSSENVQVRARWCEFYIQVMRQSLKIGNFQSVFVLLGVFNNSAVSRLKLTWKTMDSDFATLKQMNDIQEIFHSRKNYTNYWQYQKTWEAEHKKVNAKNCIIPVFGLFLTNLTFIEEANPTYLDNGRLNPTKIELLAHQYAYIQKYQKHLLTFKDSLLDHQYHYNILYCIKQQEQEIKKENKKFLFDDAFDALHNHSLTLEPPALTPPHDS